MGLRLSIQTDGSLSAQRVPFFTVAVVKRLANVCGQSSLGAHSTCML